MHRRQEDGLCNLSEEEDLDQPLDEFDDGRGQGFSKFKPGEKGENVIFRTEIPPDEDMIGSSCGSLCFFEHWTRLGCCSHRQGVPFVPGILFA